MASALVTGGAGFIGSHVADSLIGKGYSVTVLDDLSGGFRENVNPKADFVEGSVNDAELVAKVFAEKRPDFVFHMAAYAAEGLSHFIRRFNYDNNLMGSINVINESIKAKVKCLVFSSSIAVYGKNQVPLSEDTAPMPEDPYGISKLAVEFDLRAAHEMFGLDYIIFRPHNVYGERQNLGDKYRNVVGIFMNQILSGEPLTIFGDGGQKRAFSYIGDVAPLIAGSIENKKAYNQVFNIGADQPYTVNELAAEVVKAMGANPDYPIRKLAARNEVVDSYSSHEKIKSLLGYSSKYRLSDGLRTMAEWAKAHGSRKSQKFENIEITEKLPESWTK